MPHAIRTEAFGGPDVLKWNDVPRATPAEGIGQELRPKDPAEARGALESRADGLARPHLPPRPTYV